MPNTKYTSQELLAAGLAVAALSLHDHGAVVNGESPDSRR